MSDTLLPSATTWVEVSREALRANFATVSKEAGVPVCAVVKANAYGHGLVPVARTFAEAGARMLAVTRWEEARELRSNAVTSPVLLLTPVPSEVLRDAIAFDLALSVASEADVTAIQSAAAETGRTARVHLKIDTGMGRLGVPAADAARVAAAIAGDNTLSLEGVWTHFADGGTADARTQMARFDAVRRALGKHAARAIVHAANSAATIALPAARYDMVRIGTLLYGLDPPNVRVPFALQDPFTWYARVISVRTLGAGDSVGYGSEWRATKPTRVATIPVGYADGFGIDTVARTESIVEALKAGGRVAAVALGRRPSSRAAWIRGRRAPVVGRISMQQATLDVSAIPGVTTSDVAEIRARRLTVASHIDRVYR